MYMRQAHAFACLVIIFLGVLFTMRRAFVWWEKTWQISIEPTRASVYRALPTQCLRSFWHWRENGCRLI